MLIDLKQNGVITFKHVTLKPLIRLDILGEARFNIKKSYYFLNATQFP